MNSNVFIANLGSIHLDPAYHHLYEYGNIPIFIVVGKKRDEVVVDVNRKPVIKTIFPIRYTMDERIEDGLYCLKALELMKEMLENPEKHIDVK